MIKAASGNYQRQIAATKEWAKKQTELQNERTELAIEQIEQQREQTEKDYIKEQSGAYTDWQKESAKHGAKAEQMAAGGMTNTGYAESSRVSMYNTYQNRVAVARETFKRAELSFDNAIAEAKLQNSSALAEIAFEALQRELELSLASIQYSNSLLQKKAAAASSIANAYDTPKINKNSAEIDAFNELWDSRGDNTGSVNIPPIGGFQEHVTLSDNGGNTAKNPLEILTGKKDSAATANVENKIKGLSTMKGMTGSDKAIENTIHKYAEIGDISEAEFDYMMNYFGYDASKHKK